MNVVTEVYPLSPVLNRPSLRGSFTNQNWQDVLKAVSEILGKEVAEHYQSLGTAKIIAAIPYLAGSEDPDRFAVSNLLTHYAGTKARSLSNHRPSDNENIMRRLGAFHFGKTANQEVVRCGMNMLALIMINNHVQGAEKDSSSGKFNPIVAGVWDAEEVKGEIALEMDSPVYKGIYASFAETTSMSLMDFLTAFGGWN